MSLDATNQDNLYKPKYFLWRGARECRLARNKIFPNNLSSLHRERDRDRDRGIDR